MSHQKQYLSIEESIPTENKISLLATGRSLHYDIFNFDKWSTVHNKLRSNFMTVLYFLSLYYSQEKDYHVVVMGGLTFKMIKYLDDLFPNLTWDLWDTVDFKRRFEKSNINTKKGFIKISNDKEEVYQVPEGKEKSPVLFISFNRDMNYNQNLIHYIMPKQSIIPFTVEKETVTYHDGYLLNILWNEHNSKWLNLLVKKGPLKKYEREIYNLNCFNFNIDYRARSYPSLVINRKFDHCYDCAMECSIWNLYMLKMNQLPNKEIIENYMMSLENYLSSSEA